MGQEITARMKYRNITKKKLYSVYINFKSKLNEQILSKNIEIGQLFSHNKKFGIAYINTDYNFSQSDELVCGDSVIRISLPWWSK